MSHQVRAQEMDQLTYAMDGVTFPTNEPASSWTTQTSSAATSLQATKRIETIDMNDLQEPMPAPASTAIFDVPPPVALAAPKPVLITPQQGDVRPLDTLGPACAPLEFPKPQFSRGRRGEVLCYNHQTQQHDRLSNVLFRDFSHYGSDAGDCRLREAYWPMKFKEPIKTIMGHVEICQVLERLSKQKDDDAEPDEDGEESSCGDEDDEDDIVFQYTNRRVAVKVNYSEKMDQLRNRHAEDPLKEIAAMQLIGDDHPNVLGCKQVLFDGQNLNVVMRFCDSGDLFNLLQGQQYNIMDDEDQNAGRPGLSEGQARYWFRQVMKGVQHLHNRGVCHRDLSPENVMIDGTGALVIDMGMCLRIPYLSTDGKSITDISHVGSSGRRCLIKPQGACGKLPYMSPEIYRNKRPFDGEAIDIWTSGTILFCMLTGNRSYQRPHPSDPQFYWMSYGLSQLLQDWNVHLSPEGFHLLRNMLQIDPRLRLTMDEVLNHPWFSFPDEM